MSYSPYQQPGYYPPADPAEELLRPARRASVLMFVITGLMLLCGICVGAMASVPWDRIDLPAETRAELARMEQEVQVPLATVFAVLAGILIVPSVLLGILAFFVRKGGSGVIITSIIVTGLLLLLAGLNLITSLQGGVLATVPQLVFLALLVLLFVWLIQALKNAGQIRDLRLGQQFQQWQAMQNQQQYGGYYGQYPGQAPPPPPPPPPGQGGGWVPPPDP